MKRILGISASWFDGSGPVVKIEVRQAHRRRGQADIVEEVVRIVGRKGADDAVRSRDAPRKQVLTQQLRTRDASARSPPAAW